MFQPPSYSLVPDVTWTTADLCDERLGIDGSGLQVVRADLCSYGGRGWYFGEVFTCAPPQGKGGAMSMAAILGSPGQGRVLMADARADGSCAVLGDRMAAMAAQNGWAGIILNGYVRDVRELARMPVGIHALGARPNRAAEMPLAIPGGNFHLAGVDVSPGLWAYADADGIVLLPRRHTEGAQGSQGAGN